jgi:hypothetical protein
MMMEVLSMRFSRIGIGAAILLILLSVSGLGMAQDCVVAKSDVPSSWDSLPHELLLDSDLFPRDYVGPVEFSHKKHNLEYGVRCAVCHHFQEDDPDPVWNCGDCHMPGRKVGKIVRLMDAYHTDCRGCHEAAVDMGEVEFAPYRNCEDCHLEE